MTRPKDGSTDQFGLSSSTGARSAAGPAFPPLANGDGGPLLLDNEGRAWVRPVGATPPSPTITGEWQESSRPIGLTNDAEIRGSGAPLILMMLSGFVEAGSDDEVNYVQLYDVVGAPAGAPAFCAKLIGSQNFSWTPPNGWRFEDGIRFAVSTTAVTYAAGSTAWFNAFGWETLP
jgi:hypothetical protein